MTKQEIKDLVAAKIAGQGTQVDAAGVLPTIIDALVDLVPDAEIVTRTISTKLNDTDDEIPTSKAVKTALKKLTETPFEISEQGTTEGTTITYDVTTAQSVIDAFIFAAQTAPMEALPVVNDNGAIIRFVKIEVAEGTVTGHCRIDGGTYALHLINTDFGGNSYFSHTTDA